MKGLGWRRYAGLEQAGLAEQADLVDGGTGGFHLLGLFSSYERVILINATMDGKPAGTVSLLRPRFAGDFPPSLTAHDIGLKDLIESAALLGDLPQVDLVTVSIGELFGLTLELSAPVQDCLPRVEAMVRECLNQNPILLNSTSSAA